MSPSTPQIAICPRPLEGSRLLTASTPPFNHLVGPELLVGLRRNSPVCGMDRTSSGRRYLEDRTEPHQAGDDCGSERYDNEGTDVGLGGGEPYVAGVAEVGAHDEYHDGKNAPRPRQQAVGVLSSRPPRSLSTIQTFRADPNATKSIEPLRDFGEPILDFVARTPYAEVQRTFDANLPKGTATIRRHTTSTPYPTR